ncbi:MAG: PLD nuclease N-terminal domain-containing protein [Rhodothermia bacterium]|nr:PLD nuclease N-terminal domain-containing protein [Rhodothermia bacterium]
MKTTVYNSLGALLLVLTTAILSGCGGPNLIDRVGGFWAYGICSAIIVILDVIALIEVFGSERQTGDKVLWTLVIVFFPVGGLIIYWIFGK